MNKRNQQIIELEASDVERIVREWAHQQAKEDGYSVVQIRLPDGEYWPSVTITSEAPQ